MTEYLPIGFRDGLLESQESSLVPNDGRRQFATELVNWVCEPSGGLRARAKWFKGTETSAPPTRSNRGIGLFTRSTDPTIVQATPVVQFSSTTLSTTPTFTWPTPTVAGNTLVAFFSYACGSAITPSITATGWTARKSLSGTTQQQVAIYELVTTQSYSGDVTPFTTTGNTGLWTMWILELSGVSTFDQVGSNTASSTSVAITTGSTAQASEIALAVVGGRRTSSGAFTLSTASTGWSEYAEQGNSTTVERDAALYYGTRRTTGAESLTVTSTASVNLTGTIVTYKGWNSDASPSDTETRYLAANDDGSAFDIYAVDDIVAGTYAVADANVGSTTSGLPVAFTRGLGGAWYTHPSFSSLRYYGGSSGSAVSGGPAGRCIAIHKTRLWVGTGYVLRYSQVGDGTTWTGRGSGSFDIGRDDGEDIEDITPFAGGLVIGKRTSLHYLVGDTPDTFTPVELNAGGAAPGRSVLATPWGCVIAARDMVYLFDGAAVQPIGRAIEHSYGVADGDFVSLSYIDGSIYISTAGMQYVFELNNGTWRVEQVDDGDDEAPAVLYNYGDMQLYGPRSATEMSLLNYRTFPDPTRGPEADLDTTYAVATGDLWLAGPGRVVTVKDTHLQLRQRAGGDTGLDFDVTYDNGDTDETRTIEPRDVTDSNVYREWLQRTGKQGVSSVKLRLSQTLPAGDASCFDIETILLTFDRENR